MLLNPVIALFQFCTILPLGRARDFGEFARHSWLYPLAGYLLGGIALVLVWYIPTPSLAAAVALACVLLLSGLNHFDGLLDFGDGAMAHGSREKRIAALTDRYTGAGGTGLGICVVLIAFAGLQSVREVGFAILMAEVFAKFSMALLTVYGKPFREGIHASIHGSAQSYFPVLAGTLTLPLLLLPVDRILWAAGLIAAILVSGAMILIANRLFGGVNGDVVGAAHEITRALVIVTVAILPLLIPAVPGMTML